MNRKKRSFLIVCSCITGVVIVFLFVVWIKYEINNRNELYDVLINIYNDMVWIEGDPSFTIGKDSLAFLDEINRIKENNKNTIDPDKDYKDYFNYYRHEDTTTIEVESFFMNKFEVSQKQWRVIMKYNPIVDGYGDAEGEKKLSPVRKLIYYWLVSPKMDTSKMQYASVGDDYPIYYVSHSDALKFIKKLNGFNMVLKENLEKKYKKTPEHKRKHIEFMVMEYKLPTEIEWEYAARGGKHKDTCIFSGSNSAKSVAWFDFTDQIQKGDTRKEANTLGLYHMSGNVYEWCADIGIRNYKTGTFIHDSTYRVTRGGSYLLDIYRCRVSYRGFGLYPNLDHPEPDVGFRLAADVKSE